MKVYVLFQIDEWSMYDSRVCFGVFSTYEKAREKAIEESLNGFDNDFEICETEIDKFEEL